MPYQKDATGEGKKVRGGSHFGSCCCASSCLAVRFLDFEIRHKRGEKVSIGMAQTPQPPERPAIVTVRRCGASSCRGRNTLSRTCSVWRQARGAARDRLPVLVPARVRRHRWRRLLPLHPHLRWRRSSRPLTDPPPGAFST